MSVSLDAYLEKVEEIRKEKPVYRLGADGTGGECDCIGLIIGAIRRAGGTWTGTHGTNYTVRNEMDYLMPIGSAAELNVGEAVFKAYAPTHDDYDLPDRYDGDPDQRDYYHVGVVTGVSPLRIVHCTAGGGVDGITEDTKLGKWTYRGWLKKISREGGAEPVTYATARVTAASGKTVKMRSQPSTTSRLYWEVDIGDTVTVLQAGEEWTKISHGGRTGYMLTKYLEGVEEDPQAPAGLEQRVAELTRTVADLIDRVERLEGGGG